FLISQSPYAELTPAPPVERPATFVADRDIEFVIYGWSRAPLFATGTSVWPLPDSVFQKMAESRAPLWETIERDDEPFRVYFVNDRSGIYALGYPSITRFGHTINIVELVTLTLALHAGLLIVG